MPVEEVIVNDCEQKCSTVESHILTIAEIGLMPPRKLDMGFTPTSWLHPKVSSGVAEPTQINFLHFKLFIGLLSTS